MKQIKKETAWKKSRKFGDVKGGRGHVKLADNIFNRQHSFPRPGENQETPVYIVENPSRDFFFPITIEDVKEFLKKLPEEHVDEITHIWFRKISKKEYEKDGSFQACHICGSGVSLIIFYPFPKDLTMKFGNKKPGKKILKMYLKYDPVLKEKNGEWTLVWTKENLKKFYLEGLLLHEIGHHIDSYYKRFWSKNYRKKAETNAENYANYLDEQIRDEDDLNDCK